MFALLAIILVGFAFLNNTLVEEYTKDNWKDKLHQENMELQKELDEAKEGSDDFFKEFALSEIERNNYHIEHDIMPLQNGAWSFAHDGSTILGLVSMFTIIIAAGIVANEFNHGTIKLLLIRPIQRSTILLSKYLTVLLFGLFTTIILLFLSLGIGAIFFGIEEMPQIVLEQQDGFTHVSLIKETILKYSYYFVNVIIFATLAFMISVLFRSNALAIGVSIFLLLTGGAIVQFLSDREWAKYILFANTNLKQYANGSPPFEGMTLSFSITVLAVYYLIFITLTWFSFTKRDVAGT